MADDDTTIQITTPLGNTFLARVQAHRRVGRVRPVSGTDNGVREVRAPDKAETAEPPPAPVPWPARPPIAESHELLTPQTAATLSQIHTVESELLVRAMIEAAKSDGTIDTEERRRILTILKDAGALETDRQALLHAMDTPHDMEALVARVDTPELAAEVYAASLLAIKDDTPTQQRYLARLAERLKLSPDAVREVHVRYDAPPPLGAGN